VSNYTTTPVADDRDRPEPPGESRDDLAVTERAARLAELTLERYSPCGPSPLRRTHRAERAAIRHLERGARRARRAADRDHADTTRAGR
jgi:hypothetical protein